VIENLRHSSSLTPNLDSNSGLKIQAKPAPNHARKTRSLAKKIAIDKKLAIAGISGLVLVGLSLDWQLVIATATAIATMATIYNAQSWGWRRIGRRLNQFRLGANGKLAIAVAMGGGSMVLVYTVLAIWNSQANHWLGFAESAEFLAVLGILALLLRQSLQSANQSQSKSLEHLVLDLSSANNLQRLVAVRQLQQAAPKTSPEQQQAIAEYCQVLLSEETFIPVREAAFELLESLQTASSVRKLITD
jgi:hypothetical protein